MLKHYIYSLCWRGLVWHGGRSRFRWLDGKKTKGAQKIYDFTHTLGRKNSNKSEQCECKKSQGIQNHNQPDSVALAILTRFLEALTSRPNKFPHKRNPIDDFWFLRRFWILSIIPVLLGLKLVEKLTGSIFPALRYDSSKTSCCWTPKFAGWQAWTSCFNWASLTAVEKSIKLWENRVLSH